MKYIFLLLCLIIPDIALALPAATFCYNFPASHIASSTIPDSCGYLPLILNGATSTTSGTRADTQDGAVMFDTDDFRAGGARYDGSITLTGATGTMSLWIRAGSSPANQPLLSIESTVEKDIFSVLRFNSYGSIELIQKLSTSSATTTMSSGAKIPVGTGRWVHLVISIANNVLNIYMNGEHASAVKGDEMRPVWPFATTKYPVYFKIATTSIMASPWSLNAQLRNIAFYPSALTPEEILALYDKGSTAPTMNKDSSIERTRSIITPVYVPTATTAMKQEDRLPPLLADTPANRAFLENLFKLLEALLKKTGGAI